MPKHLTNRELKRNASLRQFDSAELLPSMTYQSLEVEALKKLIEEIFLIEENVNRHRQTLSTLNRDSRILLVATKRMEKQVNLLRKEMTGILQTPGIFYTFMGKNYKGDEGLYEEETDFE